MPHLSAFAKALIQPRRSGSGAPVVGPAADTFANALKDYLERAQRNTAPATFAEARP
jgi:hypothetical protein